MGASGGGNRVTQSQTSSVDAETANWLRSLWGMAGQAGQAGPSPLLTGASQYGQAAQTAGNTGLGALGGDPAQMARLMNPYQQQVIDANNAAWQKTNAQTANQINDEATRAGAFGGSRHGVAEGVALANNNMAQQQQTAGLLQSGYNATTDRAAQLASLGFQGAGMNVNLGFGGVGSPSLYNFLMQRQGFLGPLGSTQSGRSNTIDGKFGFSIPFLGGGK